MGSSGSDAASRTVTVHRPEAEVQLDEALVRGLLADQHPDLAGLPLRRAGAGWDNETWRIAGALAARLPRRRLGAELLAVEQRWLPQVGPRLPVPVPVPVRTGGPGRGYPFAWSVVPWFDGRSAEHGPVGPAVARRLGELLHALHLPAPAQAPHNPYRSVPLSERPSPLEALHRACRGAPPPALLRTWDRGLHAAMPDRRRWIHGDLHARNLVVDAGSLCAVIDWGDMAAGDPAVDLSVLWTVLGPVEHAAFCAAYGPVDGDLLLRARGWALLFGALFAELDDAGMRAVGRRTLARLAG